MKKILFVNSSLTSGGSERVMTLLANEFANKGYDVDMVLLYKYEKDTYEVDSKINVIRFLYNDKIKIIKKIKQLSKLRKVLKKNRYDYVFSFMLSINILTLLASLGLKNKIIISERCNPYISHGFIKETLSKILYKKAYKIVFQTEYAMNYYNEKIRALSVVIPNPIDSKILPDVCKGKREKRIVGVGRLSNQKNFKLLISGFTTFVEEFKDYKLEIYGEGELLEELKKYAKECGITDKVIFKGYVNNVLEKIKDAAMYISTSNFEGISNSMLEALAMGIPSICTDCPVGGAQLIIKNNTNGILIPVGGEKELVESMKLLAKDSKLCEKLSKNAIKVRKDYSIETIAKKWENIL